jgi:carbonic anhydrase
VAAGELTVHGWYYDILTGRIEAWDEGAQRFRPLLEMAPEHG